MKVAIEPSVDVVHLLLTGSQIVVSCVVFPFRAVCSVLWPVAFLCPSNISPCSVQFVVPPMIDCVGSQLCSLERQGLCPFRQPVCILSSYTAKEHTIAKCFLAFLFEFTPFAFLCRNFGLLVIIGIVSIIAHCIIL